MMTDVLSSRLDTTTSLHHYVCRDINQEDDDTKDNNNSMTATILSTKFKPLAWSYLVLSCLLMDIVLGGVSASSVSSASAPPPPPSNNNPTPSVEINFAGRIKCLLWGSNPALKQQDEIESLIPLPSVIPHRHRSARTAPGSSSSSNSSSSSSSCDSSIPSKQLVPLFGGKQRDELEQKSQTTESSSSSSSSSSSPTAFQSIPSWFSDVRPNGIFATIDYKFTQQQKQQGPQSSSSSSSYGLDRVGTILCWRRRKRRRQKPTLDNRPDGNIFLQRFLPSSMDVSIERSLPLEDSSSSLLPIDPPIIDVVGLHFGWNQILMRRLKSMIRPEHPQQQQQQQQHQDDEDDGDGQFSTNPHDRTPILHIQLDGSNQSSLTVGDTNRSLLSTGVFMPFGRRVDLQLISRWKFGKKKEDRVQGAEYEHNVNIKTFHNENKNPDWWLPHITLDPLGSLTSENRFTAFLGKDNSTSTSGSSRNRETDSLAVAGGYSTPHQQQQYLEQNYNPRYMMDLKLRIRTQVSILAFAAPTIATGMSIGSSAVAGEDDYDGDEVSASLRFDCSLHDCRHGHTSTARIQTSLVPSDLWYSLTGASSLSLLHEHTLQL